MAKREGGGGGFEGFVIGLGMLRACDSRRGEPSAKIKSSAKIKGGEWKLKKRRRKLTRLRRALLRLLLTSDMDSAALAKHISNVVRDDKRNNLRHRGKKRGPIHTNSE
jgi:hypothetical protein